jgi:hypothetical protein
MCVCDVCVSAFVRACAYVSACVRECVEVSMCDVGNEQVRVGAT